VKRTTLADHEHMAALVAGDDASWAKLYERHLDGLVRFCGNFTPDAQLAQDWAQEAFIKLREKAANFRPGSPLKPWLYKIARHICLEGLSRRREAQWTDSVFALSIARRADSAPSPATRFADAQIGAAALAKLAELSEEHRSVLMLKYVEGLSRQEIAEAIEIPEATVKSRLYYAMNAIRAQLET